MFFKVSWQIVLQGTYFQTFAFKLGVQKIHRILELSSNSTWHLIGSWLFCIQYLSMFEGSVDFEQGTFYIGSLRVKTHFGMPRGAKMCLALNEPN